MMLKLLAPRLQTVAGARVATALTPLQALQALPAPSAALVVVSDYNLKAELNGIELLRRIAVTHPRAVRILMSGYSADQIGFALPAVPPFHAFVEKDLRLDNIVAPILRAIAAHRSDRARG